MADWITQNTDVLSLAADMGTLAVWFIYLSVFLRGYRRQIRPKIVINRGGGNGADARCFVSNMSSEAIYVEDIRIRITAGDDVWSGSVIDVDGIDSKTAAADPKRLTRQGALGSGEYMAVGRYEELIARVLKSDGSDGLDALYQHEEIMAQVIVIADHAADDLLIAAWRRFAIRFSKQGWLIWPATIETEQVRSRAARRQIERQLRRDLVHP
jgi:hypothetical protein